MQHRSLTRFATGVFVLAALATITGCNTTNDQENAEMTPHEGRDAVVNFVVDTSAQLDAANWAAQSGTATPHECTMDDGEQGASYQFILWSSEGSSDSAADADHIVAYWDSLGMETRIADHGGHPVVYGTGGPVLRASFDTHAAGQSYNIAAVAPCAPGDATELKREANQQRKDGVRFPGDEYVPEENIDDAYIN